MIPRTLSAAFHRAAVGFPVVTLTGPRQSGKTTLARAMFPQHTYVSLERPDTRRFAAEDPRAFLEGLAAGAIIDEIQHAPELTSWLQSLVDEDPTPGRFILTGSENLAITAAASQSLAGRTALLQLLPLGHDEIAHTPHANDGLHETVWRGGYPALFSRDVTPDDWLGAYVGTYVERDVRQILRIGELSTFQTFLGLCAGRVGGLLNLSSLGADAGIAQPTARAWLSVLEASFLVFRLAPWHRDLGKRLVKTPKLYFHDTGLAAWLLGVRSPEQLELHPLRGALVENWVVADLMKAEVHAGRPPRAWFYRDQRGAEVDLLLDRGDEMLAVEVKSGRTAGADFFDGLRAMTELWSNTPGLPPLRPVLVYGGDEGQRRAGIELRSWRELP